MMHRRHIFRLSSENLSGVCLFVVCTLLLCIPDIAAAQSPGGVSGSLQLWLKAGSGVTGTSSVSQWDDDSGNGRDFIQGTGSNQPALTEDAINFNPAITFDGSSDFLEDADGENYLNGESAYTSFVVVDSDVTNNGYIYLSSDETGNSEAPWGLSYDSSGFETGHSNIMNFGVGTTSDAHKLFEIDENNAVSTDPIMVNVQWSGGAPTLRLNQAIKPLLEDNSPLNIGGTITGADFVRIGHQSNAGHNYWDGHIAEMIFYDADIGDTDQSQIQSYLAVKYGLTLSGGTVNYLDSNGDTIWNASTQSGFPNDIAGIGRDDTSDLLQYKSKSISSDAVITMSGTAANFADREFLLWGNDGAGATTWTNTGAPTDYRIIPRVWRVEENNGDTGAVTVMVDVADADLNLPGILKGDSYYFVYDTDNDGSLSDETPIQMYDDGTNGDETASDNVWSVSGITFDDGERFTIATEDPKSPGGILTNLILWYKAGLGVEESSNDVSNWGDLSGQENDASEGTQANQPDLTASSVNFNPIIQFDGSNDILSSSLDIGEDVYSDLTIFSVYVPDVNNSGGPWGNDDNGWDRFIIDVAGVPDAVSTGAGGTPANFQNNISTLFVATDPSITSLVYDEDASNGSTVHVDGSHRLTYTAGHGPQSDSNFAVGYDGDDNYFDGGVAEIAIYSDLKGTNDRQKIETYLGVKYGVTLSGGAVNYLDSNGTAIWNASTQSGFPNDIAGIGRDDDTDLDQYKSKSVNSDGVVTMSGVTANFADREFLLWGNDGASGTAWSTSGVPAGFQVLTRRWRVEENSGDTSVLTVMVDVADSDMDIPALVQGTSYYFIQDTDNDGSLTDESPQVMYDDGTNGDETASDNVWSLDGIDFDDGERFSFATKDTGGPGGVATSLNMWLRGDIGVTPTSGTLTGWTDQTSTNTFTVNGNPQTGNTTLNFNNVIEFDGNGDYLDGDATVDMRALYAVFDDTAQAGDVLFGPAEETSGSTKGYFWRYISNNAYVGDDEPDYFHTTTTPPAGYFLYFAEKRGGSAATESRIAFESDDQPVTPLGGAGAIDQHTSTPRVARGTDPNQGAGVDFTGNIAELALYGGSAKTDDEELRINSYLGIKYGITLSGGTVNYLSSNSTVLWDATVQSSYGNDIAGVGRDEASSLTQFTSKSINDDAVVTIASSSGNILNGEFLLWGNDGASGTAWTSTDVPTGIKRLTRQWRVEENTGDVGPVTIRFDVEDADMDIPDPEQGLYYYLLYDKDNDGALNDESATLLFDDGTNGDATANDNVWSLHDINFDDGEIFTIATNAAPLVVPDMPPFLIPLVFFIGFFFIFREAGNG